MMHIWNRAEQTIVGILGLVALAFALWQVLSRYILPQGSISYAEEVIVYLVIWAIMIVSRARLIDECSASDLRFPMWIYYAALPTGSALMLIRYVVRLSGLVRASATDVVRPRHHGGHDLLGTD